MTSKARLIKQLKKVNYKVQLGLGEFETKNTPLGEGGNGVVYEASINEKIVALKFLLTDAVGGMKEQKAKRFISEYFNIITLEENANIVRYIDYDEYRFKDDEGDTAIPVIIMVKYESSLVKSQENKTVEGFISLFNFLIDTVESIHKGGIIHRDIKPENILVNKDKFYLADLGIASYNPEMFKIIAETRKKERLGNRLFSAPEQEQNGIDAHQTMDIYAIGQILQWYASGHTHRGTGRQSITKFFSGLEKYSYYDDIIEKCLDQNPQSRFQCIDEIRDFVKKRSKKNIWMYLRSFHEICVRSFPKNENKILHCDQKNRIDVLMQSLKTKIDEFDNTLWWVDGRGSFDFSSLTKKGNGIWKIDDNEYDIINVWLHYDSSIFNDFILFHYQKGEPFLFEGTERHYAPIVDNEHHISYSEYQHGYAEIGGEVVDLSAHEVEYIERQEDQGYFFIGTRYNCIIQAENEEEIRRFIEMLNDDSEQSTLDLLKSFQFKIRKNKFDEVRNSL